MHDAAMEWIRSHADRAATSVLDIGGRDINGSPRALFPDALPYRTLDITAGPGVDVVADAATWTPDRHYTAVVCAEVLEHTPDWRAILATAFEALTPGGHLVATMAGPGRAPHSAVDGGRLRPGEYYGNVDPADLAIILGGLGFGDVLVDVLGDDVRCTATRPTDNRPAPEQDWAALTDKVAHGYLPAYQRIADRTRRPAAVCEVGVWRGGSLTLWQHLFPGATIVGVDRDPAAVWPDGTHRVVTEQDDPDLPRRLAGIAPAYDLIVEDASHIGALSWATFGLLWPLVAPGGTYALEDWMVGLPSWLGFDDSMLRTAQGLLTRLERSSDVESIEYRYGLALVRKAGA